MGRSNVLPIKQPDDVTCGPSALKLALSALGIRKSLQSLINLCKTNRNGTSAQNFIRAINKLGLPALRVEFSTLNHLQSALRYSPKQPRAVVVDYLYDRDQKGKLVPASGHWAMVRSFQANKSRIVLLDSATGKAKSYAWSDFRGRWADFDLKRKKVGRKIKMVRDWQKQLMIVVSKEATSLPHFKSAKIHLPN